MAEIILLQPMVLQLMITTLSLGDDYSLMFLASWYGLYFKKDKLLKWERRITKFIAYLVFLTRYAIEIREREDMKLRMFGGFEQTDM